MIWIGFIVFPLILFPTLQPFVDKGLINPPLKGIIILHSLLIGFYYFNYYIALPEVLVHKKITSALFPQTHCHYTFATPGRNVCRLQF